jgi:predicted DNA-binding protein
MIRREKKPKATKPQKTGQFSLRLPINLLDRLKAEAEERRRSQAQIVEFALEEYLDKRQAG